MSMGILGSFHGTTTAGINMLDVFKAKELERHEHSILKFAPMVLTKTGIQCPAGTEVSINGCDIPIPASGVFEIGEGQLDVTSLVFKTSVDANIIYMY